MSGFLKPWRRKLGVWTLLTDCVMMSFWLRSQTVVDVIAIPVSGWHLSWISLPGGLAFGITPDKECLFPLPAPRTDRFGLWYTYPHNDELSEELPRIPSWFIVIPLTIVSAWLLLSHQRQKSSVIRFSANRPNQN